MNCKSDSLRRKCLPDDLELEAVLKVARASEMVNKQAAIMTTEVEIKTEVHKIYRSGKYSNKHSEHQQSTSKGTTKGRKCFSCDGAWPHQKGKQSCPAFGHVCSLCKKTNHLEQVCRTKNKKTPPIKVKQVVADTSDDSSDDSYVFEINTIQSTDGDIDCKVNSYKQITAGVQNPLETSPEIRNVINNKKSRQTHLAQFGFKTNM